MSALAGLEPKEVFHYFEEISNIPRPSYKEEKISNYLVNFAKERNLEYYQDEVKNVIIIKEAAPGYEDVAPLMIQGHMDMVCEKEPGSTIDFENDGLTLEVNGDYISAKGTTLGGDDGIAVAYALAILDSDSIAHPRIEFICTVSEEVGMEGAVALDVSHLKAKKLLNLDSENEGIMLVSCAASTGTAYQHDSFIFRIMLVSCAGGCSTVCELPAEWEKSAGNLVSIHVAGLKGGHSGVEIDKGRANSNILLGRILLELKDEYHYQIAALSGGNKQNAIPRESAAELMVQEDATQLVHKIEEIAEKITHEFSTSDPDIQISVAVEENCEKEVLTEAAARKTVLLINLLPNGILRMSDDIKGLVETSLNLGVLNLEKDKLTLQYAVRSAVGTAKEYLLKRIAALVEEFGGRVTNTGNYPAWEYRRDSVLRDDMVRIFKEMYGKEPTVEAIHAGLECGILAGKIDGLDAVSIGPDMIAIHTTEEKLSISSTKRVWDYILKVIACK